MSDVLVGKRIVLGVTGSIAAYKAVMLASTLTQAGALVDVIMTREAQELIRPLSFQAITHRPVATEMFQMLAETEIGHVSLGKSADVILIAPCTAHTLARLAHGLADDMLTTTYLASTAPVIIAPAMDAGMYEHPAVVANVEMLKARGCAVVEPTEGYLASGRRGSGRLAEPVDILEAVRLSLARGGDLSGWRIVITAGGTEEPIDPVRFISNRSSGKMGFALAEAARDRGATVTLISAPTALTAPRGVTLIKVITAAEMESAVIASYDSTDALIMAAAVADYRPVSAADHKIKKLESVLSLELERTTDILGATALLAHRPVRVGFAAETREVVDYAREKLVSKRLDFIAANDVSEPDSGFGTDTNRVTLVCADGSLRELPLLSKRDVADVILDTVLESRSSRS